MIRVALAGHRGRVGSALAPGLAAEPDLVYVGGVGREDDLAAFLARERPAALIDFTRPEAALGHALQAAAQGVIPIVGTSGLSEADVDTLGEACGRAGCGGIVAPNFALGAVVMMWLAERAAPFFEAVEVIETHQTAKVDAPSATALATARLIARQRTFDHPPALRELVSGSRGGEHSGVGLHSLRLPGVIADQEVIFGLPGQTLALTHRTTSREAYLPGVLLALRSLVLDPRFHRGLETLLDLR
ncbi:MAG TPA: 4-hydroxy-tetrahydrodipicolinate reductase [Candidatus Nitrosotalea sp.]|nr:4-hydroxy-tetrahydrodipicolinate reductase [Candidatus Nitrosotalea sp.]